MQSTLRLFFMKLFISVSAKYTAMAVKLFTWSNIESSAKHTSINIVCHPVCSGMESSLENTPLYQCLESKSSLSLKYQILRGSHLRRWYWGTMLTGSALLQAALQSDKRVSGFSLSCLPSLLCLQTRLCFGKVCRDSCLSRSWCCQFEWKCIWDF